MQHSCEERITIIGKNDGGVADYTYTFPGNATLNFPLRSTVRLEQIQIPSVARQITKATYEQDIGHLFADDKRSSNSSWVAWQNLWTKLKDDKIVKDMKFTIYHYNMGGYVYADFKPHIFKEEDAQPLEIVVERLNSYFKEIVYKAWPEKRLTEDYLPRFVIDRDEHTILFRSRKYKHNLSYALDWRHHHPNNLTGPWSYYVYLRKPFRMFTSWDMWLYRGAVLLFKALGIRILPHDELSRTIDKPNTSIFRHVPPEHVHPYEGEKLTADHPFAKVLEAYPLEHIKNILRQKYPYSSNMLWIHCNLIPPQTYANGQRYRILRKISCKNSAEEESQPDFYEDDNAIVCYPLEQSNSVREIKLKLTIPFSSIPVQFDSSEPTFFQLIISSPLYQ